jgi:hypothetical protein
MTTAAIADRHGAPLFDVQFKCGDNQKTKTKNFFAAKKGAPLYKLKYFSDSGNKIPLNLEFSQRHAMLFLRPQ